jgi:hypothetical protein
MCKFSGVNLKLIVSENLPSFSHLHIFTLVLSAGTVSTRGFLFFQNLIQPVKIPAVRNACTRTIHGVASDGQIII